MLESASHLVFLDESGDHSLEKIDQQFPVFALAATIFEKEYYLQQANPLIDALKYKYWGHRGVIFHSIELRKAQGVFTLLEPKARMSFMEDMYGLIDNLRFQIIAAGIHKMDHTQDYRSPRSPYHLTLEFIMERLFFYFKFTSHRCLLIAESRGQKENHDLYQVFHQLMHRGNDNLTATEFQQCIVDMMFIPKRYNENGHQISDLMAYPIARKIIDRANNYIPYEQLKGKFYARPCGDYWGYGFKAFPQSTNLRMKQSGF
ncbi:DUF3800 domain-containing protein [Marininema halotolerans]|uniref:DUF3800 domain-containing protein n=1 Tax=Marininema halotolerans TaxID=1155944 RepID=A0A1I6PRW9_9BACL|nr:DUF3800 domain-containing protein [Marininema halotolerans]SFS42785.1 Protein of unknown function [Marininema halotolerans]